MIKENQNNLNEQKTKLTSCQVKLDDGKPMSRL